MLTQMVTLSLEDGGSVTLHASELKYRLRGKAPEMKKVVKEEPAEYEIPVFPTMKKAETPVSEKAVASAVSEPAENIPEKERKNKDKNHNQRHNNRRRNNRRRNGKRGDERDSTRDED
jgi:hypothetical protein